MNTQILVLPEERASATRGVDAGDLPGPWNACCEWLDRAVKGITASMERVSHDGSCIVEFQNWPLVSIRAYRLENGVTAIGLTFATNRHERRFEITGVKAIQLERDAAGFPTVTEFETGGERVVLRFTERPRARPIYTSNSWGE